MDCDQCHEREAVIHLTQIVNEQVTTLHLCERCAAEKGVESPGTVGKTPLGGFLAAMGKGLPGGAVLAPGVSGTCPRCGATLQDFRESGRLGCAECYRAFEQPLRDLLRRLHGSTFHVGERYVEPGQPAEPKADGREALREQLRLAIESENFELAAELRDRLRALE
jgi:protein arginine kinase activator